MIPSLEEFTNAVKGYFQVGWWNLSAKQVDDYIYGEEAQELITNRYNEAVKKYKNKEITERQFMIGIASSAGNCLIYMY